MFELVHFSIIQHLNRAFQCSKSSLKPFHTSYIPISSFSNQSHLYRLHTSVQYPQSVHNMDRLSSMGMEPHNCGVQPFDKYGWYQVMGHLEKCAFETNAAIAQLSIRPY